MNFPVQTVKKLAPAGLGTFKKRSDLKQFELAVKEAKFDIGRRRVTFSIFELGKAPGQLPRQGNELGDLLIFEHTLGTAHRNV